MRRKIISKPNESLRIALSSRYYRIISILFVRVYSNNEIHAFPMTLLFFLMKLEEVNVIIRNKSRNC